MLHGTVSTRESVKSCWRALASMVLAKVGAARCGLRAYETTSSDFAPEGTSPGEKHRGQCVGRRCPWQRHHGISRESGLSTCTQTLRRRSTALRARETFGLAPASIPADCLLRLFHHPVRLEREDELPVCEGEEDIGGPVYNEDVGVYERPAATDHERLSR